MTLAFSHTMEKKEAKPMVIVRPFSAVRKARVEGKRRNLPVLNKVEHAKAPVSCNITLPSFFIALDQSRKRQPYKPDTHQYGHSFYFEPN